MTEDQLHAFIDMAVRLRICLEEAWARFRGMPPLDLSPMCVRTRANIVHDFWTEAVAVEFAADKNWSFIEDRGLRQLAAENMLIRFKKVNRRRLVAAGKTRRSKQWIQLPVPGIDKQWRLSFVYRPDRFWTEIVDAGLALQVGGSVVWFLSVGPIQDETDETQEIPSRVVPERGFRVKPQILEQRRIELFEDVDDDTAQGS